MSDDEILFDIEGDFGRIHLNQPTSFNALTRDMCQNFRERLLAWGGDERVKAVLVTAEGARAFCAGGDIRGLYAAERADPGQGRAFFWDEYRLVWAVHHFPKPFVALVDGIVMGGGAGISVHGSHRVMTELTTFAMPETGIGLFPDVGASHFLSRCPGEVGMYLGLSGARLKAADAIHAGIGTHHAPSARLPELAEALCRADSSGDPAAAIDDVLDDFTTNPGRAEIPDHRPVIDKAFAGDSVEEIIEALRAEDGYWAIEAADTLEEKSPTSLKITHRLLRDGPALDFDESLRLEYRMASAALTKHDFLEGVRAAVVDKDRSPKWLPKTLAEVAEADIDADFAPLGDGELRFD